MPQVKVVSGPWSQFQDACTAIRHQVFRQELQQPAASGDGAIDASATHYLALLDKRPIATARLTPHGHLDYVAVLKPFRRHGIARALLQHLIAKARESGLRKLTTSAPSALRPLFEPLGFHPEDTSHPNAEPALHILRLSLDMAPCPSDFTSAEAVAQAMADHQEFLLTDRRSLQCAALALARHSHHTLYLSAPRFDSTLAPGTDFIAALSALIRRHPHTQVRLLFSEVKSLLQYGGPLLRFHRRLPSRCEIRQAHPAYRPLRESYLIADQQAILYLPNHTLYRGHCEAAPSRQARLKSQEFLLHWAKSRSVKELQNTTL